MPDTLFAAAVQARNHIEEAVETRQAPTPEEAKAVDEALAALDTLIDTLGLVNPPKPHTIVGLGVTGAPAAVCEAWCSCGWSVAFGGPTYVGARVAEHLEVSRHPGARERWQGRAALPFSGRRDG